MTKKHCVNISVLVAAVFLTLLIAESILAVFRPAPRIENLDVASSGGSYQLTKNKNLIYIPKPHTGLFKSYGHRGTAYAFEKKPGKQRVLFLGDSVVEGYRVPEQDRFTEILNSRYEDRGYEIINLGVCGYSFLQTTEYFKTFGYKFHADQVIFCMTYNDLRLYSGEIAHFNIDERIRKQKGVYAAYYTANNLLNNYLSFSNLYRYFRALLLSQSKKGFHDLVYYELGEKKQGSLLKELKNLAAKKKFKLKFVFLPVNTDECRQEIAEFKNLVRTFNIQCLDLEAMLQKAKDKKKFFLKNDPCHLSLAGHKVVAFLLEKSSLLDAT